MEISQILAPAAIKVVSGVTSKKRLLQEVGEIAQLAYGLPAQAVCAALVERETLGPTGVGHGVALPHARLEGVKQVQAVFLLLDSPVDFDAIDRQPVDLACALIAPEDAGVEHLKALALISRTLRDTSICAKLRSNPDTNTLYAILTETRPVKAA